MYATAFEGLLGYLHLTKNKERLEELLDLSLKYIIEKKKEQNHVVDKKAI